MLIGIIIGSTRKPRCCPQIAEFIVRTIEKSPTYQQLQKKPELRLVDLDDWNLPMYNESKVPSQVQNYQDYDHEHTRQWSLEIQKYDAFIFVAPQYNWGYPAALKNALDYLFNEWRAKPAAVATYGGHGGVKCNEQLRVVLQGLRMIPTENRILLSFADRDVLYKAASGSPLDLLKSPESCFPSEETAKIEATFSELYQLAEKKN
ncbi:LAFA_0G06304g1_1 [Lachancea sp. 'fantastica']|nr:LAFA_0G06304g1_1 [Lachancea sp. 'fantastica']